VVTDADSAVGSSGVEGTRRLLRAGRPFGWAASLVAVLALASHVFWVSEERGPMLWDDAHYALGALRLFDGLVERGVSGFCGEFLEASGSKAPFLSVATVPLFLVFGRGSTWAFATAVLLGLALACAYAFRLVRRLADDFGGLVAVLLLCTMPAVAGLSRQYMVEVPLLAVLLGWHFHLLRSDFLSRPRCELSLGVLLGIGMLLKVTFPLFISGSVAVCLGVQARRLGSRWPVFRTTVLLGTAAILVLFFGAVLSGKGIGFVGACFAPAAAFLAWKGRSDRVPEEAKRWLGVAVIGFVIAGSWYSLKWASMAGFAWSASFGGAAGHYFLPLTQYLAEIASYGVSNLQVVFLGGGLLAYLWLGRRGGPIHVGRAPSGRVPASAGWMLALWLLLPLAVFLTSRDRIYRWVVPCLAPLPLAGGILATALRARASRAVSRGVATYALLGTSLFTSYSFGFPRVGRLAWGPFVFWGTPLGWDQRPPSRVPWPHERVARASALLLEGERENEVMVLFDQPELNLLNLQLAATRLRLDVSFRASSGFRDLEEAERSLARYGLVLVKEGGRPGLEWYERISRHLAQAVRSDRSGEVERVHAMRLPDGGELLFYRQPPKEADSGEPRTAPCRVDYGGRVALTGLGVKREGPDVTVRLEWETLADLYEDYAVLLHFTGGSGLFLQGDYAFSCRGRGTAGWRKGRRLVDVRRIHLGGEARGPVLLAVGVYEPHPLTVLPVVSSTAPLREDGRAILLRVEEGPPVR
jgi:4-amino-4-deoxy-L-arabinose transferase-like glycosyltransferase